MQIYANQRMTFFVEGLPDNVDSFRGQLLMMKYRCSELSVSGGLASLLDPDSDIVVHQFTFVCLRKDIVEIRPLAKSFLVKIYEDGVET